MKFEVPVNICSDNLEIGDHLPIVVVIDADDIESATTRAAQHVGKLEGGRVYGVEAQYPVGWKPQ